MNNLRRFFADNGLLILTWGGIFLQLVPNFVAMAFLGFPEELAVQELWWDRYWWIVPALGLQMNLLVLILSRRLERPRTNSESAALYISLVALVLGLLLYTPGFIKGRVTDRVQPRHHYSQRIPGTAPHSMGAKVAGLG